MAKIKYNKWSDREVEILTSLYNSTSFKDLQDILDRPENSIRQKAKQLGIMNERNPGYTESDDELINKWILQKVPHSIIAIRLGRTISAVRKHIFKLKHSQALDRGLKKVPRELTDQIESDVSIYDGGNSRSHEFRQLLSALEEDQSFEYPTSEHGLLRNQIILFEQRVFKTKKETDDTRRVWRIF